MGRQVFPKNWLVYLRMETEGGHNVTTSEPMYYKAARKLNNSYKNMGHQSWMKKIEDPELKTKGIMPYRSKQR